MTSPGTRGSSPEVVCATGVSIRVGPSFLRARRERPGYRRPSEKRVYRMAVTAFLAFCQHHRRAFGILRHRSRWRNIGYPIEQQITLCEDLGHHATSLRSSTRQGLGAWIASTPFQTALFTANTSGSGTLP